jgi:cytochrome P450
VTRDSGTLEKPMVVDEMPLLDMLDAGQFADGHPWALYDRMRAETPVVRRPGPEGQAPFWLLTRHRDIEAVSRDREHFTSTRGFRLPTEMRSGIAPHVTAALARTTIAMDPPEQPQQRAVINPSFLPSAIARVEAPLRQWIADRFDALAGAGEIDFVAEIGAIIPIKTLCLVLGLPPGHERDVFDWSNAVLGSDDPEYVATIDDTTHAYDQMFALADRLLDARRADPRGDLMTAIAQASFDGAPMPRPMQQALVSILITAGNETTRNSLSGAMIALARHPAARARLAAEPELIGKALHEIFRYVSPVYHMMRTAIADVEVGGAPVRAGDRVVMLYGAANRDPEIFDDPHALIVDRPNANRELSFGIGIHACAGMRLAMLQVRLVLAEVLRRFPDYRLAAEPRIMRSNFVWGVKALPVRLG